MPISCEDLAAQMAILEDELNTINDLIADINAAFLVETDPMARMMLTMDLSAAYQAKAEIEYDIAIVTLNQIELQCIPPMMAVSTTTLGITETKRDRPVVSQVAIHDRLEKLKAQRWVRKQST